MWIHLLTLRLIDGAGGQPVVEDTPDGYWYKQWAKRKKKLDELLEKENKVEELYEDLEEIEEQIEEIKPIQTKIVNFDIPKIDFTILEKLIAKRAEIVQQIEEEEILLLL